MRAGVNLHIIAKYKNTLELRVVGLKKRIHIHIFRLSKYHKTYDKFDWKYQTCYKFVS